MLNKKIIKIANEDSQIRIDVFLSQKLKISRSSIQNLIKNKLITVNNKNIKANYQLKENDQIIIQKPQSTEQNRLPSIKIIQEHPQFLIVDKPAGLLSQPLKNKNEISLIEALIPKYPELKQIGEKYQRYGLVHRLDREVSGVMVIARNNKMFKYLKQQFKLRKINKMYTALVYGIIPKDEGYIDFPLKRSKNGKIVALPKNQEGGRDALTKYKIKKYYQKHTLLEVYPKTGRTHQIRVHLKSIGHPIVGDHLYTIKKYKNDYSCPRLFLHASKLEFEIPNNQHFVFTSFLPKILQNYLKTLKEKQK